ncbi:Histidinol-phosphate transaminase [Lentibacillus sp. JNUCC-1]|uniref:histidinol-phosphate transaminase n=1 Tax=Lentibacillus sp. JNUCC-1 TaxID=2654513 RepID=UPI00132146E7|nr:Histidinol-phosphate transaminase [Lentibacillus sp. JNUCC-1]
MTKYWSEVLRRTEPYIPGEQPDRSDILKLNTNENPYPPSPKVIEAIQETVQNGMQFYPSPTVDHLREKIAAYHHLNKENVFIGNGSDEVLAFSFMAFFEPNQPIIFPEISYSFYPVYAKLFNIPYETAPLNPDFSLRPDTFFNSKGGVIFPNPNAPTSVFLSLQDVEAILQNNPDQVVIIDEAYVDFAAASAVSFIKMYDNLLVVQTMSKSRSLAGLRIGFAMGNPDLIEGLMRIKDSFNSYTIDRLAIAGAEAAIEDVDYFKTTTSKIIDTRESFAQSLKTLGFEVLPSQTNFLFVQHPTFAGARLYEELKKRGIIVRHFNKPRTKDYLRITIGTSTDMARLLSVLSEILNDA